MRTILTALLLTLLLCSAALAGEIRLSAAASMTDAVKSLISSYRQENAAVDFQTNFAASGTLARQIFFGAPTDLFISANPVWMDYLVAERQIAAETVHPLAGNTLVFVGDRKHQPASLDDIVRLDHIAIGSPNSVPVGDYARQALTAAGIFDRLQGRLVMAKDARQALIYADRGETAGAFIYRTDALLAKRATILLEVSQELYPEIIYPVGLTPEGVKNPDAVAFLAFLKSAPAKTILKDYGFTVN